MRPKRNALLVIAGAALVTIFVIGMKLPQNVHGSSHGGSPRLFVGAPVMSQTNGLSHEALSTAPKQPVHHPNDAHQVNEGYVAERVTEAVTTPKKIKNCLQPMSAWREACAGSSKDPMVFGLMISGKDYAHLPLAHIAVDSFVQQTHQPKALLIVNDGPASVLRGSEHKQHPCVCEHHVPRRPDQNLGALRNIAMGLVPPSGIWVQWDDDDWRNKTCLHGQLNAMREQQAGIVFLRRQIHLDMLWNSTMNYEYGDWGLWGTMMANTSVPAVREMQLPNLVRGEDNFYDDLRGKTKTFVWPNDHHMYFRVIHGHNTWDREHFKPDLRFKRNEWCRRMEDVCTSLVKHDTTMLFDLYRKALNA